MVPLATFLVGTSSQGTHPLPGASVHAHTVHDTHVQARILLSQLQPSTGDMTVASVLGSSAQRHRDFRALPRSAMMMCKRSGLEMESRPANSVAQKIFVKHSAAERTWHVQGRKATRGRSRVAMSHLASDLCTIPRHPKAKKLECALRLTWCIRSAAAF